MSSQDQLLHLARQLGADLLARQWRVTTVESCTGGLVAAAITEIAGSSQWFDQGLVTYSNQAKARLVGVSETTLARFGAVSEQCALEMAQGALIDSGADLALAITGIAGPGGATAGKPVGTVCFGVALRNRPPTSTTEWFGGDRAQVRQAAGRFALELGLRQLQQLA